MSVLKEFRDFAMKGNVIDLAVGLIIGAAFGMVVGSLVNDIIMPLLSPIFGSVDFSQRAVQIKGDVYMRWGNFVQMLFVFLVTALAIFMFIVKPMNEMKKKEASAPAAPPAPTNEEKLLAEIRDLLKNK